MRLFAAIAVISMLAVAAVGCRESEPVDFGDEIPDGAPQVDQRAMAFHPNSITVSAGDTVYFTNSETTPHTVDVDGENISGRMDRGDVVAFRFDSPGEYAITCPWHPQMRATVIVE